MSRTVTERSGPSNTPHRPFLAGVLGALSKHGTVLYHLGPATGRWKYNGTISLLAGCRPFYWRKGSDGSAADSAIEYKHQNVGAVMIESGFACIRDYKPKGNF